MLDKMNKSVVDSDYLNDLLESHARLLEALKAIHTHLVNNDRCFAIMTTLAEAAIAEADKAQP